MSSLWRGDTLCPCGPHLREKHDALTGTLCTRLPNGHTIWKEPLNFTSKEIRKMLLTSDNSVSLCPPARS